MRIMNFVKENFQIRPKFRPKFLLCLLCPNLPKISAGLHKPYKNVICGFPAVCL